MEESYITPKETSNEWAGPNVRAMDGSWEGIFVGRRVRIPLGPRSGYDSDDEDDDRNGKVRSYDKRSGLIASSSTAGCCGATCHKHIKVVYGWAVAPWYREGESIYKIWHVCGTVGGEVERLR